MLHNFDLVKKIGTDLVECEKQREREKKKRWDRKLKNKQRYYCLIKFNTKHAFILLQVKDFLTFNYSQFALKMRVPKIKMKHN